MNGIRSIVPCQKPRQSALHCFFQGSNQKCLEEINRLRKMYCPDLPQYTVSRAKQSAAPKQKRKLTSLLKSEAPPPPPTKRGKIDTNGVKQKAPDSKSVPKTSVPPRRKLKRGKRIHIRTQILVAQHNMYRYYPLTPKIQQQACRQLGVQFSCDNGYAPDGPKMLQ